MNTATYILFRTVGVASNLLLVAFGWQWVLTGFKESSYLLALSVGGAVLERSIGKINDEVVDEVNR